MFLRILPLALAAVVLLSSCSQQRLVANGARHEHPIHLGDEYTWQELTPVEVTGKAVFGIPSGIGQIDNVSSTGLIINLDGPGGFRFPKLVERVFSKLFKMSDDHFPKTNIVQS